MITVEEKQEMASAEWDSVRIDAAAKYLEDIKALQRQVSIAEQEIETIMARLEGGTIRYDKPNVMTSPTGDSLLLGVSDLVEAKKKLKTNNDEAKAKIQEATEKLIEVSGVAGFVLRMHYLMGFTYKHIAEKLGLSEASTYAKRQEGLLELYESGLPFQYRLPDIKAV